LTTYFDNLKPWLYWSATLAVALLAAGAVIGLHQLRPDENVIQISNAEIIITDAPTLTEQDEGVQQALPDDWRQRPYDGDVVWYRLRLDLDVAPNRLWALYVPAVEMTPSASVNGILVGGKANPTQPLARYWNRPLLYSIPNGLLRPGTNYIDIRVAANGHWGRLSEVYLGPDQYLRPSYEQRNFWRVTFLSTTMVGSLIVGLFMVALSLVRKESVYAWFAAFSFSWYLHNLAILTVEVPVDNAFWDLFIYIIVGLLMTTGSMFTFRFLDKPSPRWERMIQGTALIGTCTLGLVILVDVETFNAIGSMLWIAMLLVLTLYPLTLMARVLSQQRSVEVFFLSVCYLMAVALGAHDWLVTSGIGYRHSGLLMQFATAPTLTTFGIILLKRFVNALRDTEQLNLELEQRVTDKAIEIEVSYRRHQELENAQLLSRERERIMRDMHDGFGGQIIAALGQLDHADPRDQDLALELRSALQDMRLMIDSLEDVDNDVLVALGLFRNRVQSQLDTAGFSLNWNITDLPPVAKLGPERVLHFLRILQETVTNCIKHSQGLVLTFETSDNTSVNGVACVCVTIKDDGIGLSSSSGSGRGLTNMRYRADSAGLELEFIDDANGTTIRVGFPIH
jgi:signal transduction histidine kinase